jgi:hypothetical protein
VAPDERAPGAPSPAPIYLDTRFSFQERAADLLSRMTLAEKVAQLRTSFERWLSTLPAPFACEAAAPLV